MKDKFWERADRVLGVVIILGMAAMTLLLCMGVAAAAAWVVRFIF